MRRKKQLEFFRFRQTDKLLINHRWDGFFSNKFAKLFQQNLKFVYIIPVDQQSATINKCEPVYVHSPLKEKESINYKHTKEKSWKTGSIPRRGECISIGFIAYLRQFWPSRNKKKICHFSALFIECVCVFSDIFVRRFSVSSFDSHAFFFFHFSIARTKNHGLLLNFSF